MGQIKAIAHHWVPSRLCLVVAAVCTVMTSCIFVDWFRALRTWKLNHIQDLYNTSLNMPHCSVWYKARCSILGLNYYRRQKSLESVQCWAKTLKPETAAESHRCSRVVIISRDFTQMCKRLFMLEVTNKLKVFGLTLGIMIIDQWLINLWCCPTPALMTSVIRNHTTMKQWLSK